MKKALIVASVASMIEQFNMSNIKLLQELGYKVDVATNFKNSGTITIQKTEELIKELKNKNVDCIQIDFNRRVFSKKNIYAYKQIKKTIDENNYDLIHMHSPIGGVCGRIAAKKARKKGTRVIYTAHGFHFFKGAPITNWLIFYPVEKYLSKYTDCLITINQEDYELAKRKFKKCKQIELIHGVGVDNKKFNFEMPEQEKHKLKEGLGLADDDFVLIQVGELNKNKNQIMAIDAMKELVKENNKIHLLLVGKGELEEYYKNKIREYKLENNIHILGYRTDIPSLMKISNVLLSLSYREGLPVNVIEGIMTGLPIIATDCRGNRELVERKCIVKDEKELIDNINSIFNNYRYQKQEKDKNNDNVKKYELSEIEKQMRERIYFKKKIVLHVLASNNYSGAEYVVFKIIENLKSNYTILYCSPNGPIKEFLEEKKIKFVPLRKLDFREIKKVLREYNPDVVHAHDFRASVICSALNKNKNLILHIHNNAPWIKKISINSLLFLIASLKSNKILTVSESIEKEYIFSKYIKNKIKCIGNPLDVKYILKKVKNKRVEKRYDICCTARLTKQKNPIRFVDIINKLKLDMPNVKALWIGDGEMKDEVEQRIKKLNLENNIKLLGFKKNPYNYMKQSKIFLLTSDWEGYGIAAFEALTLGLPCIVSNVGGLSNIVDDTCGKLCEKDNLDEYIIYIKELLLNKKVLDNYAENAIKKSNGMKNIKEYMDKLIVVYNEED